MNNNIEEKYSIVPFFNKFYEVLRRKIGNKSAPLILLQGGFGKHNTGDDTLMLVAREQILKVYPDAKIYALCHNPQFLKEDYNIKGIKYKSLDTLKYLFKCDALVVPAGGLVNDLDYNSYIRSLFNPRGKFVFISMLITVMRKKCTVLFGVGIHNIPDFIVNILLRVTLPKIDLIGVRDKYSVSLIKAMGCKNFYFAHDPVISYRSSTNYDWQSFKQKYDISFEDYIVINFRLTKNVQESTNAVEQLAEYWSYIKQFYHKVGIVFVPCSVNTKFSFESDRIDDDIYAMRKIIDLAKEKYNVNNFKLIDHYLKADEIKIIAEHSKLLVLTRHHAPVITYSCHVPTIVISYNFKCREFAELGEYKYIIDYDKITASELCRIMDLECGKLKD